MVTRKNPAAKRAASKTNPQDAGQDTVQDAPPASSEHVEMFHADGRSNMVHLNSVEIMQGLGWSKKKP